MCGSLHTADCLSCRASLGALKCVAPVVFRRRATRSIDEISRQKVLWRRQIYSPRLCGVRRAASVVKPRLFAVISGTKRDEASMRSNPPDWRANLLTQPTFAPEPHISARPSSLAARQDSLIQQSAVVVHRGGRQVEFSILPHHVS
jgi:hypothetical protein